ncbi:MAG: thiamine biosynthesis protein ApbE [Proteobacteria bacterium]|nr:MAG: thiamine biosynthesis protein ApbE [Pseudomonadota bacterium]
MSTLPPADTRRDGEARWPLGLFVALLVVGGGAAFLTRDHPPDVRLRRERRPQRIMGTSCRLMVVVRRSARSRAGAALQAAESALRDVERRMSSWIGSSELSRFNRGPADRAHPLSAPTLAVLKASRALFRRSGGAFDITCRPLIQLWRHAGKSGKRPTRAELRGARAASGWPDIALRKASATKTRASARVDLGGIAKGYGIDRAVDALRAQGAPGGLVDVGGDLRVYGLPPLADRWEVAIRDPFAPTRKQARLIGTLAIKEGAVCTSGNYARFSTIEGKRYSHILDPRSGEPADAIPSVTVIGPDAMRADGWATALSVLGESGLARLPKGFEAMLVLGKRGAARAVVTPGFAQLFRKRPPFAISEVSRPGR